MSIFDFILFQDLDFECNGPILCAFFIIAYIKGR